MKNLLRVLLIAGFVLGVPFFTGTAEAQMYCNQCEPTSTSCDTECAYCDTLYPNNEWCAPEEYHVTTCGDFGAGCLNCSPNWVETSRVNQGTYGDSNTWQCSHHRVDRVTETDVNHCSTQSWAWTRVTCDDYVDGQKFYFPTWPDCCDGQGPDGSPNSDFTCNDYHSCY